MIMDNKKLVQFHCPEKLLKQVDKRLSREGRHSHRTDLLLSLLRKYVEER